MYLFVNDGLDMSAGKIAAQVAHAAVEAYLATPDNNTKRVWHRGGHYAKYVMHARDSEHLRDIERYLNDRGFDTVLIIDEGHTEIDPIQPTALGVVIVDRDDAHVQATFSSFDLYRKPRPSEIRAELAEMRESIDRSLRAWWRRG